MADDLLDVCPNCYHIMVMHSPELDVCPNCGQDVEYDPMYDNDDEEDQ